MHTLQSRWVKRLQGHKNQKFVPRSRWLKCSQYCVCVKLWRKALPTMLIFKVLLVIFRLTIPLGRYRQSDHQDKVQLLRTEWNDHSDEIRCSWRGIKYWCKRPTFEWNQKLWLQLPLVHYIGVASSNGLGFTATHLCSSCFLKFRGAQHKISVYILSKSENVNEPLQLHPKLYVFRTCF